MDRRDPLMASRRPARSPAAVLLVLSLSVMPLAGQEEEPSRPRLSPLDFKVFKSDTPLTGTYRFAHPVTGASQRLELRAEGDDQGQRLVGVVEGSGARVLALAQRTEGVGWEGELRGILTSCGQDRVAVSEMLPLGDSIVLRLEANPPQTPCAFLEDRQRSRLVVAPTSVPIRLRSSREIVSSKTREQIGLAGEPGGPSTPIVAGAVSVEGGTELKFLGRTRSLDGSVWIEVEALVSPAPGIEPPRGFVKAEELRVDASITLRRVEDEPGR